MAYSTEPYWEVRCWRYCKYGNAQIIILKPGQYIYICVNYTNMIAHGIVYWDVYSLGVLLLAWINFNPTRDSSYMPSEVWDDISCPFPIFEGYTADVLE